MKTLTKDNKSISYHVLRKDNKNTYFRVKNGYLLVTTNHFTHEEIIINFIKTNFDRFFLKMGEKNQIENKDNIQIWGKTYTLLTFSGSFKYVIKEKDCIIYHRKKDMNLIKKDIYKSELIQYLKEKTSEIEQLLSHFNIQLKPYKLKYMKSKFGSYHKKNQEITLNTYLAKLEPKYLEYVLLHEYAHTKVFNHQKDFYNLLSKMYPNYKQIQKDLKKIAII